MLVVEIYHPSMVVVEGVVYVYVCVCEVCVCVCALNLNSCQLIFGAAWLREETNNHFTKSKGAALVGFVFAAG